MAHRLQQVAARCHLIKYNESIFMSVSEEKSSPKEYVKNCPYCDESDERIIWKNKRGYNIVRCKKCGFVYRNPRYMRSKQDDIFTKEWTERTGDFHLTDYREYNLRRIAKYIQTRRQGGALLDVGCSYGVFFSLFNNTWEFTGIEPSLSASQIASRNFPNAKIINNTIENASLPEGSFDVITIVDTIYYVSQPLEIFKKCYKWLNSSGRLIIESPNFSNRYYYYRLIGHNFDETWTNFYTPKTLIKLLDKAVFKKEDIFHIKSHSVGNKNPIIKLLVNIEYVLGNFIWKLSFKKIDLCPHFVLVSIKK